MRGYIRPSEAVSSARKVSPAFFVLSDGLYPSVAVFIVGLGFQRCGKRQSGYGLYRFGHAAGQAAFRAAGGSCVRQAALYALGRSAGRLRL